MMPDSIIETLELVLGFGLIIWFLYGPWQSLIIDTIRQHLFEIRDSIFLLALDGSIDLNSEEYKEIRRRFNALIRFCHSMKWPQLIAFAISCKASDLPMQNDDDFLDVINKIQDKESRSILYKKRRKTVEYIAVMIWLRSPFLVVITMLSLPFVMLFALLNQRAIKAILIPIKKIIRRDIDVGTAH